MRRYQHDPYSHNTRADTYNHLLHLILHTHPADDLHILHPAQDLVLYLESCLHPEGSTFLDSEGMLVETLQRAGRGEVDDDVGAALDF